LRRIAEALRSLLSETVGLEGAFTVAGLAGLTFVAWATDWLLGVAVASVTLLVIGIALARPRPAP
jgi:hypothetical protein